ncbi:MAG: hypothetical protein BWY31_02758 [Lentisphaerae bacterium ADurb.Bin242]|nr:MAG: hypothetical protein BWY31_02758 [Lentisphaerae bacterium ADurb.Bin242]
MKKIHIAGQFFLNDLLDPEELKKMTDSLANAGYESLYLHARAGLRTPYLSEKWFEAVDAVCSECAKKGITASLWDEDYFPSGTAGNRIIWEHPELAAQKLVFTVFEVPAGTRCEKVFEADGAMLKCFVLPHKAGDSFGKALNITEFTGTGRLCWKFRKVMTSAYSVECKIPSPHWRAAMRDKRPALLWEVPREYDCTVVAVQIVRATTLDTANTDLLNPRTADEILKCTHERYAERYGKRFSEFFPASFFDEPNPGSFFPWTGDFADEFFREHKWDIRNRLFHLCLDIDETTPLVRDCYRRTQGRLQCENYLRKLGKWCTDHAVGSIGHLPRTEFLSLSLLFWPDELRCAACADIPCTDPLGFHTALPDASAYHTGIKVVTSAARLFGKEQAGSDALAVMGDETSLRDLAFQMDYQLALGITYFNIHGLSCSLEGPRKDEVPPPLFFQHSEFRLMKELLSEIREKAQILSSGTPIRRLLVLYPGDDIPRLSKGHPEDTGHIERAFHRLSESLLSAHRDFDFIDESMLCEKDISLLRKDYDALLVYSVAFLRKKTAEAMEKFAASHGRVVISGNLPRLLMESPECPQKEWTAGKAFLSEEPLEKLVTALPGLTLKGEGAENIFIQERLDADRRRFFLFNRSDRDFSGLLEGRQVSVPAGTGCFAEQDAALPGNIHAFACTEEEIGLDDGWELRFGLNSLPLHSWNAPKISRRFDLSGPRDDAADFQESQDPVYENTFLFEGTPENLLLAAEKSMVSGPFRCFTNGHEIFFKEAPLSDPLAGEWRTLTANITSYVIGGSVPRLNTIRIECTGMCALNEAPFLHGDFTVEFRHGHAILPNLKAVSQPMRGIHAGDWRECGFGTYSGSAVYKKTVRLERTGRYIFCCGRVEDAAEVFVDGRKAGCRFRAPYAFAAGELEKGEHVFELRISNGPANRDRMSGLPAGLFGPVKLVRLA